MIRSRRLHVAFTGICSVLCGFNLGVYTYEGTHLVWAAISAVCAVYWARELWDE